MRIRKETKLKKSAKKSKINKVDLSSITNIVNRLNELVAFVMNDDYKKENYYIQDQKEILKNNVLELKLTNSRVANLQTIKIMKIKKLKIISLLHDLHKNFNVGEHLKRESLKIIKEIDSFSIKRMDKQIEKLNSALNK